MVSISPDLSVHQRIKLKALKATKKDLNDKLTDSSEYFYYGIRNNKILKIKKDINNKVEMTEINKKLNTLSAQFTSYKNDVNNLIGVLFSIIKNDIIPNFNILNKSVDELGSSMDKTLDISNKLNNSFNESLTVVTEFIISRFGGVVNNIYNEINTVKDQIEHVSRYQLFKIT